MFRFVLFLIRREKCLEEGKGNYVSCPSKTSFLNWERNYKHGTHNHHIGITFQVLPLLPTPATKPCFFRGLLMVLAPVRNAMTLERQHSKPPLVYRHKTHQWRVKTAYSAAPSAPVPTGPVHSQSTCPWHLVLQEEPVGASLGHIVLCWGRKWLCLWIWENSKHSILTWDFFFSS